eukprot:3252065-Amphidinium_carterae.1
MDEPDHLLRAELPFSIHTAIGLLLYKGTSLLTLAKAPPMERSCHAKSITSIKEDIFVPH